MANKWIEFVRDYARRNNISYGCAVSTPECKAEYRAKYGVSKPLGKKKEAEMMGAEDIFSREAGKYTAEEEKRRKVEESRMMGEDYRPPVEVSDETITALRMILDRVRRSGNAESIKRAEDALKRYVEMKRDREGIVVMKPLTPKPKAKKVPRKLIIEEDEVELPPAENIQMEISEVELPPKKTRGRPKKYSTAEEAKKAKYAQTTASKKRTAEMRKKLLEEARAKLKGSGLTCPPSVHSVPVMPKPVSLIDKKKGG